MIRIAACGLATLLLASGCNGACIRNSDCPAMLVCMEGMCVMPVVEMDAEIPDGEPAMDAGVDASDADADADADAETDADADADAGSETDAEADAGSETDAETDAEADADAAMDSDAAMDVDAGAGDGGTDGSSDAA